MKNIMMFMMIWIAVFNIGMIGIALIHFVPQISPDSPLFIGVRVLYIAGGINVLYAAFGLYFTYSNKQNED